LTGKLNLTQFWNPTCSIRMKEVIQKCETRVVEKIFVIQCRWKGFILQFNDWWNYNCIRDISCIRYLNTKEGFANATEDVFSSRTQQHIEHRFLMW
jgi:hypothetical protein